MAIDYTSLIKKLTPSIDGEPDVHLRVGTVNAINSNGTLDITMSSGLVVPSVPRLSSASVSVGNVVQMISFRGSLMVIGTVAGGGSGGGMASNRIATTIRNSSSGNVTSEATVDSVAANLVTGKTYRITWDTGITSSVAADTVFIRLREDSVSGDQLNIQRIDNRLTNGAGSRWAARIEAEYTAVATGSKTFVGTLTRNGTGNAQVISGADVPVYLYVDYIRG